MKNQPSLPAGEYIKAGDLVTIKDGEYYKVDPIEIYTVEKPSLFWDKIVPIFLLLAITYFIGHVIVAIL